MIRIKNIHIEEFRGIRVLDLDLATKNFGICGPNGSGKSGVVDAVEFCITGDVTRLSGQGSADLSVKAHAPHVDQHEHPEKSNVTITADIPSLGKSVKIHRSVKNPRKVQITPNDADVKAVIEELQTHPEFALSRREIIKYIITPPGKRSEDVQTLLRLEHIEKLRKNFKTFCNKRKSEEEEAARSHKRAETDLKDAFKIDKLNRALVLEKVNEKRKFLGLQDLTELTKDVSFKAGVAAPEEGEKKPTLRKTTAIADISALLSAIKDGVPPRLAERQQSAKTVLQKLKDDKNALTLARRHGFIKTGLDLVTEDACPLCDTEWNAEELRGHLRKKLLSAEEIEQLLGQLRDDIDAILQSLSGRIQMVERAIQYSQGLKPPLEHAELSGYLTELKSAETALTDFVKDNNEAELALQAVSLSWWSPKADEQARINECHSALNALPDTSAEDEARNILTVAQERYEKLLAATRMAKERKARSQSFAGWTVDTGPRVWDDHDIWTELQNELDKNDVPTAAGLLRRYLEYTANILADNLRVRVEFRGNGHYDLGDLMPHVLKEWRKRLEDGETSAAHWKRDDEKNALAAKRAKAKELIAKTNAKQWAINPSVHFNQWANLQPHEFREVVTAFKELLENLHCENPNCKSYLYVLPRKGKAEEMRCNCGATSINLKARA